MKLLFKAHIYFWIITSIMCILLQFINPVITPMMIYRHYISGYKIVKHHNIKLSKIKPSTKRMVLRIEDSKFYSHFGFDFEAIQRAIVANSRSGRVRYGGSTITQQTARMLFLTYHRNYLRKYLEMWITIEMEVFMTKNRTLELYLNYTEWGKGIFGIDTASRYYYGRTANKISKDQARRLVAILANPIGYDPSNFYLHRSLRKRYNLLQNY